MSCFKVKNGPEVSGLPSPQQDPEKHTAYDELNTLMIYNTTGLSLQCLTGTRQCKSHCIQKPLNHTFPGQNITQFSPRSGAESSNVS